MVLTAEQHHPNIKIFVSAHKQATFPEGNSIVPVQVGAANAATRISIITRSPNTVSTMMRSLVPWTVGTSSPRR